MLDMATRKKNDQEEKPRPSPRVRVGKNVNAWLPDEVVDAFHRACDIDKRTRAAELEIIMTEWLVKRRLLKAPDAAGQS